MNLEYLISDVNGKKIASTISLSNKPLLKIINNENYILEYHSTKFRVGFLETSQGSIYCISSDKNYIKSSRKFLSDMNMLILSLEKVEDAKKDVEHFAFRQVDILFHNLKNINAHLIQDMYDFLPQTEKNEVNIYDKIKLSVKKNPERTARLLFKVLKNNMEMKAEFSVFSKLYEESPLLNFKEFNLYLSVLNVLYNFFPDFTDKNISVKFEEKEVNAYYDYESIHVALFHMIDNITKYIKPDTTLYINFDELLDESMITFDMISLKINDDEIENIFEDGYSGENAILDEKAGKGIGMSRVKKLLELNSGNIILERREEVKNKYQNNVFIIHLKKDAHYFN
jgi:signal transduction histidine kinase